MKAQHPKQLAQALFEMTDGKTEADEKKAIKEFVAYLGKHRLLKREDAIIAEYRKLYNAKHGIVEASVTLVERLPEKTRIHLRETLKKKYKAREVHMLEWVDERLIGGMKIQVGDTVYDSSIKNTLKQLETKLLAN